MRHFIWIIAVCLSTAGNAQNLSFEEDMRRQREGYPTAAEALRKAHEKFKDFKERYALVREADRVPKTQFTHYRLWDDATWDSDNRMTKPWAEEWFYWSGNDGGKLVKGKKVYVVVVDQPRKGADPKTLQAYLRFNTKK